MCPKDYERVCRSTSKLVAKLDAHIASMQKFLCRDCCGRKDIINKFNLIEFV